VPYSWERSFERVLCHRQPPFYREGGLRAPEVDIPALGIGV
jgi:hypothetical protein